MFKETELTDEFQKVFFEWHRARFPLCRGGIKLNNHCKHFECFFAGWAAAKGNYQSTNINQ